MASSARVVGVSSLTPRTVDGLGPAGRLGPATQARSRIDRWMGVEDSDLDVLDPESEAKLQALVAAQREARAADAAGSRARQAIWLAHHWPDHYERCVVVGARHVCRRCLALYPLTLVVMALSLAGAAPWPESIDPWPIWLLCVPATLEYVADALRWTSYSPRRQVAVTLLVAVALGRGLSYEMANRWSWEFWGPLLVFGTVWFVSAVVGHLWGSQPPSADRA